MSLNTYYYNCSPQYIDSIDSNLHGEVDSVIRMLPKRKKQSEINADLFWLLTSKDWCFDTVPAGYSHECPATFDIRQSIHQIKDIFADVERLRMPEQGHVCTVCGLVQGGEQETCAYCGSTISITTH